MYLMKGKMSFSKHTNSKEKIGKYSGQMTSHHRGNIINTSNYFNNYLINYITYIGTGV